MCFTLNSTLSKLPFSIPASVKISEEQILKNLALLDMFPKMNLCEAEQSYNYVLTGGPCTGKSTLINKLFSMISKVSEAASYVIALFNKEMKNPRDWEELNDHIIKQQVEWREKQTPSKVTIFDRSEIDTLTYSLFFETTPSEKVIKIAMEILSNNIYNSTVFLSENLGFVEPNEIRTETKLEDVVYIENALKYVYTKLGFKVVLLPNTSVEERKTILYKNMVPEFLAALI